MSPNPDVPLALFQEKNTLASSAEWVWLYEITVPTSPATRFRAVSSSQQVTFRGNIFYPFPINHAKTTENTAGDTRSVSLTVSNVTRELIPHIESYDGLIGEKARIICTTRDAAAATDSAIIEYDFRVVQCSVTGEAIIFKLDDLSVYNDSFPRQRLHRSFCRFQYRSALCGYAVPASSDNFLSGCDKTLDGANGCEAHGTSETNEGITKVHPQRFGGFTGIPMDTSRGII
jgi:lambda family phage minor tail protein L